MNFEFILKFLKDLSKNNDRTWFEKNKPRYLEAKQGFEDFITGLLKEMTKFDEGLAGLDPKKLPFRIYRDVRFSKDKSPYKVNMGAGFSPNGKLVQEPGYYIHIEPGKSFVAGGIYMPDAANLAKVRQEIDYNADKLMKVMNSKSFKKLFKGFDDFDKLKTMPKGYAKDHPHIELLKHKSFIVSYNYSDKDVTDKKFMKTVAAHAKEIKPLNDFIREAIA
ncbi:TIGR02453 family protein [Fulvivirgaceae bacterium PWU4]|uniref:TIGR02453 family protein n=1 Tax=Chryseosolibacter histidini TaxID=2782349 RepID=A0AAP2DPU4_9BACT|nr:DUF2461 domain-containing protein [Chryseosolibacter histidini]MBT1700293.1 TIGR02453 family protein [Chryseosolibacter histidini]